ncbi:MAG: winged helix-turn-helix transcriptional regulator [Proteobacteria bacterium]|nr:winged helix-turn-helix transcriptional regulator [Pseudomonadota bacterium]
MLPLLKALADDSRLRILWMLEGRELCVCEIQAVLGLAQSTVSRHLQVLEDAGFVVSSREGLWKNYRLHPSPTPVAQSLLATLRLTAAGDDEAAALRRKAVEVCRQDLCGRRVA